MVRPIPDNPFEVDYDKTTDTHLAVKIRKTYSTKTIKVEYRQRNGKYLIPRTIGTAKVKLTPLLDKPDEKIKPVEIEVIGNKPYKLNDNPVINGYEVTYKRTKETIGNSEAPLKAYFKKYNTTSDDALTAKTIANPDVNSVTVRLKNGEAVTLTKENGYTLNIAGKPKYDTNDNAIDYSVDTVDAPNGYELLKIEGNKDIVLRAIPEHYTTTISTNFKSYNDNPFKGSTEDYIYVTVFRTTNAIDNNNFDGVTGEEVKKSNAFKK